MDFIPNKDRKQDMLREIGLKTIDELFIDIPKTIRTQHLNLPEGLTQQHVEENLRKLAKKNKSCYDLSNFLGGGIKQHYIPSVVKAVLSRSEFYTAYTPYQPEASQGFLQAMFEYQSMVAEITGMDVANASLYDGVTALGEAALMCTRVNKRKTFLIPESISWEKKSVLKNYIHGAGMTIKEIPYDRKTGKLNTTNFKNMIDNDTTGVYIENPNFFGIFEDEVDTINSLVKQKNALFVVGIDPLSLGIIKNPGTYGADIVLGEGRGLGSAMEFGGPGLGFFASKQEFIRQLPGRIIGLTKDAEGKQAFCMTLQTREQHIRRGKATSNICTNEGLYALAFLVHLSWLGSNGLEELSRINFEKGQQLSKEITAIKGFEHRFTGSHFNEFVVTYTGDIAQLHNQALQKGVHLGLSLKHWYPELHKCLLFGVTELHTDEQIAMLLSVLKEVS